MKRIIVVLGLLLLLTGCTDPVTIAPDVIDVRYDEIGFVEDNLVLNLFITNGTDEAFTVNQLELWLDLPDELVLNEDDTIFCGAVYTINQTIQADGYAQFEVIFEPGYIFMSEDDLASLEITLQDLVFHYEFI